MVSKITVTLASTLKIILRRYGFTFGTETFKGRSTSASLQELRGFPWELKPCDDYVTLPFPGEADSAGFDVLFPSLSGMMIPVDEEVF